MGARQLGSVRRLALEVQGDTERLAALLEDLQEPLPAKRCEAVTPAGDDLAALVDVDVVPAGELPLHAGIDRRVGVLDAAQRLVGEHHAEAEGVVGGVALPHRDLVCRVELLGERCEVEAAGAATDHRDPHLAASRLPSSSGATWPARAWPRPLPALPALPAATGSAAAFRCCCAAGCRRTPRHGDTCRARSAAARTPAAPAPPARRRSPPGAARRRP